MRAMNETGGAGCFVGRAQACRRLAGGLRDAEAGRCRFVLVTGEAGIGKTSLVRHVLEEESWQPAAWGTCWADSAAPGYWPWTQALNTVVARVGRVRALVAAGEDVGALATVVTSLEPVQRVAAEPDPARARLLFFDAIGRWLTALARDPPSLLALHDLQRP